MKLRELFVENYGVYSGRNFSFGDGLQLIYGANEAGKSTLLQLVRELLFGFPHQSPYAFDAHTGKIAAIATLTTQDGRSVRFRRHKGRKDTVNGEIEGSREIVDETRLAEMLGNASSGLYQHVFGFSLAELAAGEQSLDSANLSEALYGGGIGGLANFQQVQQRLQKEHIELYNPRGRGTKQKINQLLKEIRERTQALRDAAVKPRQFTELQERFEEQDAEVAQQKETLDELRRRSHRLERLEQAFESWSQCTAAKEQLAEIPACDGFPANGLEELRRLKDRLETVEDELNDLRLKQETPVEHLPLLETAPPLIDAEGLIRTLYQDVGRMRSFLQDLPVREQECEALRREIRAKLRELNPDWTPETLQEFQSSLAQRDALQQLSAEQQTLQQRGERLTDKRAELDRRLSLEQNRLAELPETHSLAALEDLVERSQDYLRSREKVAELQHQIASLEAETAEFAQKLHAGISVPDRDALATLPLPLPATVREFASRMQEFSQRIRQEAERVDELKSELDELELARQDGDGKSAIITREQLLEQRRQRNEIWQRIRRTHIEKSGPLDDAPAPEELDQQIAATDQLADDRFANAAEVARREELTAQIDRKRKRCLNAERSLNDSQAAWDTADAEWRAIWQPCGFEPLSPTAMLDWIALHEDYTSSRRRHREAAAQLAMIENDVQKFEAELQRGLPTPLDSAESSLAEARRQLTAVRDAANERLRLDAELPDLEAGLRGVDQELSQLATERAEWRNRWQTMLQEAGFPANWPIDTAVRILTELAELRRKHGEAESLEKRIADMRAEFAAFESQVKECCERIADDLLSHPAPDAVLELQNRVDAAKQAVQQQSTQSQAAAVLQHEIDIRAKRHGKLCADITALLQRAGVDSEEEFTATAENVQRRTELQAAICDHEQNIRAIRGNDDEQQFLSELQRTDVDQLHHDCEELKRQIDINEKAHHTAVETRGITKQQIEQLDGESRALQVAAELESSRSELSGAVDRWATLVLAESLMQRALQRFEQDHQPAMLNEVSRLLKTMTGGRYIRLQRRLDERGTLLVEQSTGELKTPSQLSTGTREQLYLAIRLAFVLHYCRDSEPLPLVMDDVLVNFDAQRARHTLDVLFEVSQSVQILFLTCHRHMVDLFQRVNSHCEPIELGPSRLTNPARPPLERTTEPDRPAPAAKSPKAPSVNPKPPQAELFPQ